MKRIGNRARELLLEMLVGAFMFVVLLSLAFFTIILSRENYLAKTYPMEVVFEDVMGLRDGDNVVIRGMTVGKVKTLALGDDGVHVTATLQRPLRLKEDYSIRVISTSVLGGRYLQVDEGRAGAVLPAAAPLRGETPRDFMLLAADVVADFREITAKVRAGEGTLGKLVTDEALYNDARDLMGQLKQAAGEGGLLAKLDGAAGNLEGITAKVRAGEGTLGKLVTDEALYNDVRDLVGQLKQAAGEGGLLAKLDGAAGNLESIAAKINRGEGTLGKLVNEDGLYTETMATLGDARKTLDDIRETSPLVTFTSILFGAL